MKSLADLLWTLVRWTLPLSVAAIVVTVVLGSNRIGEEVRRRVEARLAAAFPGVAVRVAGASLVEGEGIVVRGLSFEDPAITGEGRRLLVVEEVRVACGTSLQDLVAGEPRITAVRLIRPVVHATRGADGRWNLSRLLRERGTPLQVPVGIDDATLFVDSGGLGGRLMLRTVAVELRPLPEADGPAISVRGSVAGDLFDRAGFEGRVSPRGDFALAGRVESLDVSPRSQSLLPTPDGGRDWLAGLRGRLDIDWRASGRLAELERVDFAASGRLEAGHFEHAALPVAISDVSADFTADRGGIVCERVEAHSGSTLLRGSGRLAGWDAAADFDLLVEAERMVVGHHWEGFMPAAVAAHWSKLLPAGEVDVRAHVVRQAGAVRPDVSLRCRNVSLTYYRFPYRVDRTVGTVTLKDTQLALHLTGEAGGHPVHVEGAVATTAGGPGFVEVRGEGMRIDEPLLAALPPRSAEIVRSLRAAGTTPLANRKTIEDRIIFEYMVGQIRRVAWDVNPGKIQEYYDKNKADFVRKEQVKLRQITITQGAAEKPEETAARAAAWTEALRQPAKIAELLARYKVGGKPLAGKASFADVAERISTDDFASKGGDAGWRNVEDLNKTVVEAVRKLKPGEVSAPLKFEVGSAPIYVIVSPEATRPQGYAAVNDPEVMSEIETKVRSIGMKLAIQRWLDDLRAKHYVQVR
jgi:hypothetical protein